MDSGTDFYVESSFTGEGLLTRMFYLSLNTSTGEKVQLKNGGTKSKIFRTKIVLKEIVNNFDLKVFNDFSTVAENLPENYETFLLFIF